jgi:two-component system sensor histidine kinase TorS
MPGRVYAEEPLRILVVDDEPEICEMLDAVLTAEGWDVEQAGSADEALARCDERRFDLVVFDHNMPRTTGLVAAHRLLEQGAEVRSIVLFSAYLTPLLAAECNALGVVPVDKTNWQMLVQVCRLVDQGHGAPAAAH